MASAIELSTDVLERVSELVRRRAGLVFDDARRPVLEAGVRTAMRRSGSRHPDRYIEQLEREADVLDELLAEVTVGETYFFRDTDQFALLRNRIIPELFRQPNLSRQGPGIGCIEEHLPTRIRIWSAACATGEEPYSLAILLHQLGWLNEAHILGTDISRPALQRARQARYSRWSLRGVPDDIIATYFRRVGDRFALVPTIRDAVEFRYLNLADDRYPSLQSGVWGMDLILCRNALIYFALDRVPQVAERLLNSLTDKGWLFLGSADPLLSELSRCSVTVTPAGVAYQRYQPAHRAAVSVQLPDEIPSHSAGKSETQLVGLDLLPVPVPVPVSVSVPTQPLAEGEETLYTEPARRYTMREYRLAADAAAQALTGGADTVAIHVILINSLVNCGELEEAEAACRNGRDRYGASAELAALHAFVLLETGHTREAELAARQALYLEPTLSVAHLALGTALVRLRDASAARRAFRNAERLLAALPADALVTGAGDEPAGRLAELARAQLTFLHDPAS